MSLMRWLFGKGSVKIANSTYHDIWVKVDADRKYVTEAQVTLEAEIEKVKVGITPNVKFENLIQKAGYSRIPSGNSLQFDVPQRKNECYVSAVDSENNWFGEGKCFRATNGTYFNIVLCSDFAMRKGFKNKLFRCAEGPQEYWGPVSCPGCGMKKCKAPMRSGSDGWCGNHGSVRNARQTEQVINE